MPNFISQAIEDAHSKRDKYVKISDAKNYPGTPNTKPVVSVSDNKQYQEVSTRTPYSHNIGPKSAEYNKIVTGRKEKPFNLINALNNPLLNKGRNLYNLVDQNKQVFKKPTIQNVANLANKAIDILDGAMPTHGHLSDNINALGLIAGGKKAIINAGKDLALSAGRRMVDSVFSNGRNAYGDDGGISVSLGQRSIFKGKDKFYSRGDTYKQSNIAKHLVTYSSLMQDALRDNPDVSFYPNITVDDLPFKGRDSLKSWDGISSMDLSDDFYWDIKFTSDISPDVPPNPYELKYDGFLPVISFDLTRDELNFKQVQLFADMNIEIPNYVKTVPTLSLEVIDDHLRTISTWLSRYKEAVYSNYTVLPYKNSVSQCTIYILCRSKLVLSSKTYLVIPKFKESNKGAAAGTFTPLNLEFSVVGEVEDDSNKSNSEQ